MTEVIADAFKIVVARAAERLVSVRHDREGSFVTTPLMYPSGGAVVIWVDRAEPNFLVTDFGFAARECVMMGAERRQFNAAAALAAEAGGVEMGADGCFRVVVSDSQLEGAIKTVAGCSQEATLRVSARLQERHRADVGTILQRRLIRLFGEPSVAREVEFKGASTTAWRIDLAVSSGDNIALFETVSPYFPSVASTLAKFGDIRLLEGAPSRMAVLPSKNGFGTWMTALAQNGNVVEAAAVDDTLVRVAALL